MASYQVTLQNQTTTVWTLVVFIKIPDATGMLSVAWKLTPPVAGSGSNDTSWTDTPAVALGTLSNSSGSRVYKQNVARAAAVDQAWTVTKTSTVLDLTLTGSSLTPGQIEITNASGQLTNVALGYDNTAAVYAPNLPSGLAAGFIPLPQYWVTVAQSMQAGQVIANASSNANNLTASQQNDLNALIAGQFAPPQQLKFPTNQNAATVTISLDGDLFSMTIAYGPIV